MIGSMINSLLASGEDDTQSKFQGQLRQNIRQSQQQLLALSIQLENIPSQILQLPLLSNVERKIEAFKQYALIHRQNSHQHMQTMLQELKCMSALNEFPRVIDYACRETTVDQCTVVELKKLIHALSDESQKHRDQKWEYYEAISSSILETLRKRYTEYLEKSFKSSPASLEVDLSRLRVALELEPDSTKENICNHIEEFYKELMKYHIADKRYIFLVCQPLSCQQKQAFPLFTLSFNAALEFEAAQAKNHFDSLLSSLRILTGFWEALWHQLHLQGDDKCFLRQINCRQELMNSYFDYIMPYLSLREREQLYELLSQSKLHAKSSVFELLVGLKYGASQNAPHLNSIIQQLVEMVVEDELQYEHVHQYLQIYTEEDLKQQANLAFFVCSQMVVSIDEKIERRLSADEEADCHALTAMERRLLKLREDLRHRIHQGS